MFSFVGVLGTVVNFYVSIKYIIVNKSTIFSGKRVIKLTKLNDTH